MISKTKALKQAQGMHGVIFPNGGFSWQFTAPVIRDGEQKFTTTYQVNGSFQNAREKRRNSIATSALELMGFDRETVERAQYHLDNWFESGSAVEALNECLEKFK